MFHTQLRLITLKEASETMSSISSYLAFGWLAFMRLD